MAAGRRSGTAAHSAGRPDTSIPYCDGRSRLPRAREQSVSSAFRRLNSPEPVEVEADEDGLPRAVRLAGRVNSVSEITATWRIVEGWWRPRPIDRTYYTVEIAPGATLTLFYDHITRTWAKQTY